MSQLSGAEISSPDSSGEPGPGAVPRGAAAPGSWSAAPSPTPPPEARPSSAGRANESRFEELKRYLRFGPADSAALAAAMPAVQTMLPEVVESFYARLTEHEDAVRVLADRAQVLRLVRTLTDWLRGFFAGPHDEAYFDLRSRIGRVHVAIGLEPRYMVLAMGLLREHLLRLLDEAMAPGGAAAARAAVAKLCDIELAIMIESWSVETSAVERGLLDAVIEACPVGLAMVGANGRLLLVNRWVAGMLGGDGEGSRTASSRDLVALGARPEDRAALAEVLAGERVEAEIEASLPGEGRRTVRVHGARVAGRSAGSAAPVVSILQDVTALRAHERKAERASRLAAIGELCARIAHEIRNPLAGIAQAVRVLAMGFEHDPVRDELSRALRQQIGRLNGFIEDLLVMARPARLRPERVSVRQLVEPPLRALAQHPTVRTVTVRFEDAFGGDLDADPRMLAMVVDNLVINAAQMPGTTEVVVRAAPDDAGDLLLRFEDDGPGIADEIAGVLFEPFATTRVEGTGLGLSTTRRIIEAHGGSIAASNRPEGGARFEVRLPRRGAAGLGSALATEPPPD